MKTQLTDEQQRKLSEAIGDGNDFPKMTDDPQVNHAVDQLVDCPADDDDKIPDWDDLDQQEREIYVLEALAFCAV